MNAHLEANHELCRLYFSERKKEFWRLFGPGVDENDDEGAKEEDRVARLERELEDVRRALGYVFEFLIQRTPDRRRSGAGRDEYAGTSTTAAEPGWNAERGKAGDVR